MQKKNSFSYSVFINCPFDDEYLPLFRAIIFTIYDCGFLPRSAFEFGEEDRLVKILRIISECKYSIHDISRNTLDFGSHLPRFNMPLELGIVIGMRYRKRIARPYFVMEKQLYLSKQYLSDLAAIDVGAHGNDVDRVISNIRNWLSKASGREDIPGNKKIEVRYTSFSKVLPETYKELGIDDKEFPYQDYCKIVENYLHLLGK